MPVDVETEIEIDRPREEVAAYAADPANATAWYENIESVEWKSAPAEVAVGARIAFVARFLGRRLAYTYEIRDLVSGERLVMSTTDGPFPMETTYAWANAADGRTRMTLRNRGRTDRLLQGGGADDGGGDAPGEPQGSRATQGDRGGRTRVSRSGHSADGWNSGTTGVQPSRRTDTRLGGVSAPPSLRRGTLAT